MKRISTSLTLLTFALLLTKPLFAKEQSSLANNIYFEEKENLSSISSETLLIEQPNNNEDFEMAKPLSEAKKDDSELSDYHDLTKEAVIDSNNENDLLASDTIRTQKTPKSDQKEEKKNLWVDNLSGKKLNSLEKKLNELQIVYNTNFRAFRIAKAINNFEKADSSKKRNNNLILDLSREQPFSIYSATCIFPELLKINIELYTQSILETEKSLTDEIIDKPEEVEFSIKTLSEKLSVYTNVLDFYNNLVKNTEDSILKIEKINSRTNNLTKLGFYIKNSNKEVFNLLKEQIEHFKEITEQFSLAIEYSQKQIDFINSRNLSIALKCKYLAEIRSSFKDLERFIDNYESKQDYNFRRLNEEYSNRCSKLETKIGNEEIREARIKKYISDYKFNPIPKHLLVFNAIDDLRETFNHFQINEIDKQLYELLLPYVNSDTWHIRYEEKDDKKEDKEENKEKKSSKKGEIPKLIDFEE